MKDREKAINDIETEYENLTVEELSAILSNIPVSTHPEIRLKIFIKKAKAKKAFTEDLTNSLINCVCSYLIGKEWSYYQLDEILEHLLTTMQEKRLRRTACGGSAKQYRFSLAMCIFEKLCFSKKNCTAI